MKFVAVPSLPGVMLIEPQLLEDGRGFFTEMYHKTKFREGGIEEVFVQDNLSRSVLGTLRGLHYQIDRPQGKLIWALEGEIFDVAVDIRRQSPTFGKWHSAILSGKNKRGIYIPQTLPMAFVCSVKRRLSSTSVRNFILPLMNAPSGGTTLHFRFIGRI